MKEVFEGLLKDELKKDFPLHKETIDHLFNSIEMIMDISKDYFLCKYQIRVLDKESKGDLIKEYQYTLRELRKELIYFIKRHNIQINKNQSK
ncbi:hypothetical protein [Flammeovirga sp. OC4]|uniref:hypothetical protein n=1 Tax=Flammeovirga sp. OC4 TaxID=1382345 RepID=UPI0005C69B07|nr:hypothetical protein [Flammeovirga sp. OC4]